MRTFSYPLKLNGTPFRLVVIPKIDTRLSHLAYDIESRSYRLKIGTDSPIDEIMISLAHEMGHLILDSSRDREETEDVLRIYMLGRTLGVWPLSVIQEEILAWMAGIKFFCKVGLRLPDSLPADVRTSLASYIGKLKPSDNETAINASAKLISLLKDLVRAQAPFPRR